MKQIEIDGFVITLQEKSGGKEVSIQGKDEDPNHTTFKLLPNGEVGIEVYDPLDLGITRVGSMRVIKAALEMLEK